MAGVRRELEIMAWLLLAVMMLLGHILAEYTSKLPRVRALLVSVASFSSLFIAFVINPEPSASSLLFGLKWGTFSIALTLLFVCFKERKAQRNEV